ncbi:hypothetical protein PT974_10060 [Cladobotryum mycophilum]|uniref:Uncharacterized protein n=1 Tax=Cladobotryum mycophilum TaxID=491253 RepID=A0ABR0S9Q7_9HYPO
MDRSGNSQGQASTGSNASTTWGIQNFLDESPAASPWHPAVINDMSRNNGTTNNSAPPADTDKSDVATQGSARGRC